MILTKKQSYKEISELTNVPEETVELVIEGFYMKIQEVLRQGGGVYTVMGLFKTVDRDPRQWKNQWAYLGRTLKLRRTPVINFSKDFKDFVNPFPK